MIKWIGTSEDRIISWRKYRQLLNVMNLPEVVADVANVWSNCPCLKQNAINQFDFASWPDPWQLMTKNAFCSMSQILGAFYTMRLTEHDHNDMAIEIFDDLFGSQYQITVNNGKHIINLRDKKTVNTSLSLPGNLRRYRWDTQKFYQE